jgi:LPS-assembly protein
MKVFRLKPIALLLSCACGYAGAADDTAIGLKPGSGGPQLRLQPSPSFTRIPPDNKDPVPIFVEADRIQGHQDREIEAEGTVRLRRRGKALFADWLRYDMPEDEVNAQGNVRLEQHGDVLEGTKMRFNLDTERGAMENSKYQVQVNATTGRGEGDRLVFEGQGKYRMLGGNYTSCEVGNNDWFVRAKDFEIDKGRQIGTARNASIVFLGAPILYSPYLSFSLDRQRKSGFLSPTLGGTKNSGYEFSIPYYWNIAPNYDATFTPRTMAKRGAMLNNEFRYLDPRYKGELHYDLLPNDRVKNGENRSFLSLIHSQNLGYDWSGSLDIQKVSDDTYFTDLSTLIGITSQSVLPRQGALARGGAWGSTGSWGFSALVHNWQTLQADPLSPITPPYNRSQLNFGAAKQNVGLTDFEFNSNLTHFRHPTLVNVKRSVAYPSLSLPLQTSFAYLTPKLGMHLARYDLEATATTATANLNRTVPIFSSESGVIFERNASWYGQNLLQTLEPKVYYVYIPTRNQDRIPNFESGLQDVNFATLNTENQFSGSDRINDANQVTVSVTSRLLQQESGVERLRAGFGQRFYFKSQEVTLPGVPARTSSNSDLLATLNGAVAPHWTADMGWQYTTDTSRTQKLTGGVSYRPDPGKVINMGYRYQRNVLRQVDVSSQWPLTGRLSGVARWNYSIPDSKMIEGLAGFEYNGGCWAFRVVATSFAAGPKIQSTSIFMQLELNGVSSIGLGAFLLSPLASRTQLEWDGVSRIGSSDPLDLLKRNIPGYSRQQFQSAPADDLFPGR